MYHQHDLVKPHIDATAEELKRARRRGGPRRKPRAVGSIRASIARALMLVGARMHGSAPAVINNRVILLAPHKDHDVRATA